MSVCGSHYLGEWITHFFLSLKQIKPASQLPLGETSKMSNVIFDWIPPPPVLDHKEPGAFLYNIKKIRKESDSGKLQNYKSHMHFPADHSWTTKSLCLCPVCGFQRHPWRHLDSPQGLLSLGRLRASIQVFFPTSGWGGCLPPETIQPIK